MNEPFRAEEFREFLLRAAESGNARIVAVVGAVALVVVVLTLVRRRALAEEYTPNWIAVAFGVLAVAVSMDLLVAITRALGAWTPSSAIFFLGQVFLVGICLNFAGRLSRMSRQLRQLAQEIALLRQSEEAAGEAARSE
jgi:hypothetical protein